MDHLGQPHEVLAVSRHEHHSQDDLRYFYQEDQTIGVSSAAQTGDHQADGGRQGVKAVDEIPYLTSIRS